LKIENGAQATQRRPSLTPSNLRLQAQRSNPKGSFSYGLLLSIFLDYQIIFNFQFFVMVRDKAKSLSQPSNFSTSV
jgi:hypothetical protein